MDSRDIPPQPPSSHNQLQQPPGMLMYRNPNAVSLMGPASTSQSIHHHFLTPQSQSLHQQQQQQMDQKTLESLGFGDGSSPSSQPMRFGIDQNLNQSQNQQVKKKRGRPRKYTPDGGIALGLAPTSPLLSNSYGGGGGEGGVGDSGGGGNVNSVDPPAKRNRGRPPGSSKKQLDALGGTAGVGFTPHVIEVKTGEDIAKKVMAFSDQGPRTICILSASGAVSLVTLRQDSHPNGAVTYEGRFEIITLSGSFSNDEANKSGRLSVALAAHDGKIVGGIVVGQLVAATQVQVIVGSFVAEAKKPIQTSGNNARSQNPEPASAPANMLNFGSVSQGPSSESSEENESGGSPSMHRDNNNGLYGAQQQQQQQQQALHPHQMQMYHHLWPNSHGHGQ
ncbi:AT-hook motif nuclear-localized protein 8 [Cardamine amara subsp. amara]|uniref:AT-hook motif nuclear-localized protein n=1 Tax=Cardamine amara subsp. amara TaxID=228776 RepID=A0ABD1BKQ1_CARAN